MKLFTWRDIETELRRNKKKWPKSWRRADVYNDEVVITVDEEKTLHEENESFLKKLFGKNYRADSIVLEFDQSRIAVIYEAGEEDDREVINESPLFKDWEVDSKSMKKELSVPILAFHSYKGGVGRTLSLLALLKEIAEIHEDKKKILVIDADIEAPGLTWMMEKSSFNPLISYLDILSLMHFNDMNDELAEKSAKLIKRNTISIETKNLEVEEYFLPVYREQGQTWDIYSTPEKIIATQNNKYIVTEFLANIAEKMGADMILVDLRAGITEFSAPFMFDPRVQKFFVSSTSMQSVKGMRLILNKIYEKSPASLRNAKMLLTMIPKDMDENTLQSAEDALLYYIAQAMQEEAEEDLLFRENYSIRIRFDDQLIHLGDFYEILDLLKGKDISDKMRDIVTSLFIQQEENILKSDRIEETLEAIYLLASKEITAEGNASSNMLSTGSIREIAKDYSDAIPQMVILGAKGSGKTYVYKQLISKQTWGGFLREINQTAVDAAMDDAFVLPLLESANSRYLGPLTQKCIKRINSELPEISISPNKVQENYNSLIKNGIVKREPGDWMEVWNEFITGMFGAGISSLEQLDQYLGQYGKKIVFLVDGLEDFVMNQQDEDADNWKAAIRELMQNVINELRSLPQGNIGLVVFVRRDIAEDAVTVNFEQFRNQYQQYELTWSPAEALRLALWLVKQARPDVFAKNIDILKASRDAVERELELLWGKKLGRNDSREAVSTRWIIAALSDFTGQLQARDIVRFLKYSTENSKVKINYPDRYIMPMEIRRAIPTCSDEKYGEIKQEMKSTYQILKKFEDMDQKDKQLPLTLDIISLTGEEIAKLESQGYLRAVDKNYYLPEIIRFALGFKYTKGARPRVLSLLGK